MATKNIKKILLNKDGDNFVADIENIENRITQNSSNLETAKQELSSKCNEALSQAKAYTDQEKAKYLPLTGGTVTDDVAINGALTVSNGLIRTNDTSKSINIRCTTDDKSGAKIVLNGKDAANNAGEFIITATDGTNSFDFCASPTGKLTYGDKNIVRSVNNINADDKGNVSVVGILGSVTGEIKWFAFNTVPDGYLVCNGASVSRETYADLFAKIGTTFGEGDGSTTFNIPDLRDRYIIGANTNVLGTQIAEQLPNITGETERFHGYGGESTGAFSTGTYVGAHFGGTSLEAGFVSAVFNAHKSNPIYTDNGHVYPLSLALLPCIKY